MLIAERSLTLRDEEGARQIPVRIFQPVHDDDHWVCHYEISWPDEPWSSFAVGVDAVQALQLAFHKIGVELYTSDHHKRGVLSWNSPGAGYGFPGAAERPRSAGRGGSGAVRAPIDPGAQPA